jgi:hypothetical protein
MWYREIKLLYVLRIVQALKCIECETQNINVTAWWQLYGNYSYSMVATIWQLYGNYSYHHA